jgi:hypothetical protein
MNSFSLLQALIFEPKKAFAEIAERPRFLLPLMLLVVTSAGIVFWYYQVVDLEWMMDRQLRTSSFTSQLTDAQIETQVRAASGNRGMQAAVATVATALVLVLIQLLYAAYLLLAAKVTNVQRGYRQWFALLCWTSIPAVFAAIPSAIVLMTTTTTQIDQGDLQPLSLNSLFFHRTFEQPGYALLTGINVLSLIGMYLLVLGVRTWSGRSWLFSAIFSLLPMALIGGIAAFFMGRS